MNDQIDGVGYQSTRYAPAVKEFRCQQDRKRSTRDTPPTEGCRTSRAIISEGSGAQVGRPLEGLGVRWFDVSGLGGIGPRWRQSSDSLRAIKTAIEYHRVFTNERRVQWLQTRRKPWHAPEEETVQRIGDRGPSSTWIITDTT